MDPNVFLFLGLLAMLMTFLLGALVSMFATWYYLSRRDSGTEVKAEVVPPPPPPPNLMVVPYKELNGGSLIEFVLYDHGAGTKHGVYWCAKHNSRFFARSTPRNIQVLIAEDHPPSYRGERYEWPEGEVLSLTTEDVYALMRERYKDVNFN